MLIYMILNIVTLFSKDNIIMIYKLIIVHWQCHIQIYTYVQYSLLLTSPSKSNSVLVIRSGCTSVIMQKVKV